MDVGVHAVLQAQPRCGQGIGGALHECRRAIGTRDKPAGGNGVTTSNRPPAGEGPPQAICHPFDQGAIWHARFVHGAQPSKKDYPRNERETSWLRRLTAKLSCRGRAPKSVGPRKTEMAAPVSATLSQCVVKEECVLIIESPLCSSSLRALVVQLRPMDNRV